MEQILFWPGNLGSGVVYWETDLFSPQIPRVGQSDHQRKSFFIFFL